MELNLVLERSSDASSSNRSLQQISLPIRPRTILELKRKIEAKYDIPSCLQTLRFGEKASCLALQDDTPLETIRLRDGDTISVAYCAKTNCTIVANAIQHVEVLLRKKDALGELNTGLCRTTALLLKRLAFEEFCPWLSPATMASKLHFTANGGLQLVVKLYKEVLNQTWEELTDDARELEEAILDVLWNLIETRTLRRMVIKEGILNMCFTSLLRGKVMPELIPILNGALGVLCNLSELEECQESIAKNEEALNQISTMCLSYSVRNFVAHFAGMMFMNLANSPTTHHYLARKDLTTNLLLAMDFRETVCTPFFLYENQDDAVLFGYYILMTFAQVALHSLTSFGENEETILVAMSKFLQTVGAEQIRAAEATHEFVWMLFKPFVCQMYVPVPRYPYVSAALREESLEMVVFTLENTMGRKFHRQVLEKERLVDFVTCLPWHTTGPTQQRALQLVRIFQRAPEIHLQPPSLLNITRAVVAKEFCGLRKVLSLSLSDLISELTAKPPD